MSVKFKTSLTFSLDFTVRRIAQVVCGLSFPCPPCELRAATNSGIVLAKDNGGTVLLSETEIPYQNDNDTWILNSGNNWFLRVDNVDTNNRHWVLNYRYTTPEVQKALDGLGPFLEWTLGDD